MSFNCTFWAQRCSNLRAQICDLESKTKYNNGFEMSTEEAKIMLDHLNGLCEQLNTIEAQVSSTIEIDPDDERYIQSCLESNTRIKKNQVLGLKQKLAGILSQTPTPEVNTPEPSSESKLLQSQIKKQKSHIEQIESFEINDNVCPVKAQVLYEHISELYKSFTSNHAEIEAQLDDDAAMADQKPIASQIKRRVVDIQVKLKKIMAPEKSELDWLIKESDFLLHQIQLLEPKSSVCADKAKISYNQLASLYDSFISNQMKIQTQLTGDTLETQRNISAQFQRNVIELLTNLKKIFEPASVTIPLDFFQSRSTTTFSQSGSTITNDTLETSDDIHSNEHSNITSDFDEIGEYLDLEISRGIQSDVRSMKEKQKQLQEDSKFTKEGLISINEALKSIKDDLKSIRLEREKASLHSSSANSSLIDLTDDNEQLEISRHIQSDVRSMKEKQKQLQEDLKSIKNDLRSTRLEREKANSSSVNSSLTTRSIGMHKEAAVIEEQAKASKSGGAQQMQEQGDQGGQRDVRVEFARKILGADFFEAQMKMKAKVQQELAMFRPFSS